MNGKISAGDRRIQAALIGLVGAAAVILLWGLGWTESWEARTWDWRARLLAEPGPATDEIRLILVDQNSLDWGSREYAWSWPWPREIYGVIIDHCRRMGAKALAVDVLFTEPSSYGESDDRKLGEAISRFGRLAGALFLGEKSGSEEKWPDYIPEPGLILDDPERRLAPGSPISRCAFPIPEVSRNAALLSNVQLQPDADGVYRRGKLFERFDGKNIPYLGLGAYLASHPERELRAGPGSVSLGPHTVPTDSEGHVLFRFRGVSGTHRAYSAAAVIQSEIRMMSDEPPVITDPDAFKDKYVFLGFSAPGLYDLRSSPVSGVFPGVEIHATLLDNFLSGDFIRPLSGWLVIFGICVMAGCCAFGAGMLVRPSAIAGMGLVLLSLPPVLAVAGYSVGFAFPLVPLEAAGALTLLLAVGVKYATEGRQKRFIKQAFRQYISPPLIEQLIENPAALRLGGGAAEPLHFLLGSGVFHHHIRISSAGGPECAAQ